jgi:Short C-terminal domain
MGFFKDMKDLKKLGDHHGGMPSMKQAMGDIRAVADDRGEGEVLKNGVPAKAIVKGFSMPVPNDKFAMQIPLEVHPPDGGAPYEINYVYPTARMKAAMTVGMEVPVKVLPDDPSRIAVQWDAQQANIAAQGGDMAAVMSGFESTYGGAADAAMRDAQAKQAGGQDDAAARLTKLGELREQGLLTDDEYEAKKAEVLKDL